MLRISKTYACTHVCFDYLRWFIPHRTFADKSPRHNSDRLFIYDYIRRYDDGVFHKYLKHAHTCITTGIFSLRHFIYCFFFYSQHNPTRACHREIRDVLLKYIRSPTCITSVAKYRFKNYFLYLRNILFFSFRTNRPAYYSIH